MKNNSNLTKLEKAEKRVKSIKGFYNHLVVYIMVNTLLLIFKGKFLFTLLSEEAIGNPNFLKWIDWNIYGTPILWGIGLLIHAICVFGFKPQFFKDWEERQLEKYMKE